MGGLLGGFVEAMTLWGFVSTSFDLCQLQTWAAYGAVGGQLAAIYFTVPLHQDLH
jgi:hypothetical protein